MKSISTIQCANCARTFAPALRHNGAHQEQRFCSAKCRLASHRKGPPGRPETDVQRETAVLGYQGSPTGVSRPRTPHLTGIKSALRNVRPSLLMTFGRFTVVPDLAWPGLYRIRKPGEPRPSRPDTHTDKNRWTVYNDEARDPWNYVGILHFISIANGTTFNYIVSTAGGKRARDELFEQIRSMRQMTPGALPVVRLGSTTMKTQYGTRQRPMFKLAGWQRPKANGTKQIEAQAAEIETTNPFNDDLPF